MQVIQEGRTGKQQITKKITVDQSGEKHEEEISSIIVRSPANKIVQVGTNKNKKEFQKMKQALNRYLVEFLEMKGLKKKTKYVDPNENLKEILWKW